MRREISFRVWDIKKQIMLYPDTIPNFINDPVKETDFVYMQYTGFRDKTFNMIYEGDILYIPDEVKVSSRKKDETILVVLNYGPGFRLAPRFGIPYEIALYVWSKSEIKGNMFQHRELLQ